MRQSPVIVTKARGNGEHCGDQGGFWLDSDKLTLCLVDGLGHGKKAEEAALAALDYVGKHHDLGLEAIFAGCDRAIRHTRGVSMGIALIDLSAGTLTYSAINNILAKIIGGKTIRLTANNGIVGAGYRHLGSETIKLNPGDLVMLYTDGIEEDTELGVRRNEVGSDLPGFAHKALNDWCRSNDDAGLLFFQN